MDDSAFSDFLDAEELDDDDDSDRAPASRVGTVFLVDCTATMVTEKLPVAEGTPANTGLKLALLSCQTFMQHRAISSADDMIGLVFMRTNLDLADAPRILELEKLRETPPEKFQEVFGCSTPTDGGFSIHEALWTCQNMFNKASKPLGFKNIFIVTDDPNPVGTNIQLKRQAIAKATDLQQSGINLEIFPIQQEGFDFNIDTFYKAVLPEEQDGDLPTNGPLQRFEDLLERANVHELNRRRLARLPLFLVPSSTADAENNEAGEITAAAHLTTSDKSLHHLVIGVSAFCLVRRAALPKQVHLSAASNEPVTVKRRFYKAPARGSHPREKTVAIPLEENLVLPQDIMKCLKMGSRSVCFEKSEIAGRARQFLQVAASGREANRFLEHGFPDGTGCVDLPPEGTSLDASSLIFAKERIHLLGFKPLQKLKPWYHVKTAQFIYPDELVGKGSILWFTTLLSVCLKRAVFGMALYVQRRGLSPRLVALVPQAEKITADGRQIYAPGFQIIYLPYKEDFRQLSLPTFGVAPREEVDAAKEVVRRLTMNFDPEDVANPRLQRHFAELEALALERPQAEEVEDLTLPRLVNITRRAGAALATFQKAVGLDDLELTATPAKRPKKRQSTDDSPTTTAATKRSKPESDLGLNADELRLHVEEGTLTQLTVAILKQSLTTLGLKAASGRKADLVEAISKHFND